MLLKTKKHTNLSPIRLCKLQKGCTRLAAASDKVYQLLAHDRWFYPGTPASSTTKTGRHDIAEILLKVTLKTNNQSIKSSNLYTSFLYSYMLGRYTRICRSCILLYASLVYSYMPLLYKFIPGPTY